jgi:hypothetical protein
LNAVQPPLGGVEIRTVIESSGEGFVVCLIPAGADGPYLDKNEGYYRMRVSDNFVVIPHDILRRMFFPRTSPSLSIRLKARAHNERFNPIEFIAHIKNTGSASARDLFVVVWTNLVYSNYSGTTAFRYIQDEDHLGTAETLQLLHPHREAAFLIAEWDFDLVRSKPTASGRATRRASSDPAYS